MHRQFSISPEEGKRTKWPHGIFLINPVFTHIFVFIATVAVAGTLHVLSALVLVISFSITCYIMRRAQ